MAARTPNSETVAFGGFELDCRSGDLRRAGASLKLQPQPAKVLVLLVKNAGTVVTRQELAEQVWGAETFVDFEHGLNYAIRQIRTVLEDDAEHPRYLETLPKRGYRFIAKVEAAGTVASGPAETSSAQTESVKTASGHAQARKQKLLGVAAVCGLLGFGFFAWTQFTNRAKPSPGSAPIRSLAVLPLTNLSS
ncbi:MAG TPA: winged helix-turn-helix domain-containing protein, partial [Candidatus Saccharimonadales bacterium]|nr:winged helix-turn-helix domain-containing protein [Candidatus Saccharimonadales bacterium]